MTIDPQPCRCGNPLPVIRVEGRSGDTLTLARPGGESVRILPLAIGSEAEEVAGVRRVQIVQVNPAALMVKIEPKAGADRESVAALGLHALPEPGAAESATRSGACPLVGFWQDDGA